MKELLQEQSKRRQSKQSTSDSAPRSAQESGASKAVDQSLIDQLKRKFGTTKTATNESQKKKRV
jgi:hypothetical protein